MDATVGDWFGHQGTDIGAARSARDHHRSALTRRFAALYGALARRQSRGPGIPGPRRGGGHPSRADSSRRTCPVTVCGSAACDA